jgi:transcriptional regulator of acetoin/glycerol metabolism
MANRLHDEVTALTRAILEAIEDGAVLFDLAGKIVYANAPGRMVLRTVGGEDAHRDALLPRLARLGSKVRPIWLGDDKVGEVVFMPAGAMEGVRHSTLAERERQAIIAMLSETGWKLTESARRLGISRTTLWRRLRDYGIDRDHRARWSRSS